MNKFNFFSLKIRPTILVVFLIVVAIAVSLTLSLQYYFSKQIANDTIVNSVEQLSHKTEERLINFDHSSSDLISLLELSNGIATLPKKENHIETLRKFTTAIQTKNFIYAIYIGYDNGDFYEVINLENNENLKQQFHAKKGERWLFIKIIQQNNKRVEIQNFLNKNLETTREVVSSTDYNPIKRPWYIEASGSHDIIKTKPYMFSNLKSNGVTYAKKLSTAKGVIGIDISLQSLSKLLTNQVMVKGSHFYLFDEENEVIASNIKEDVFGDNLEQLLQASINKNLEVTKIKDKEYFVSNIPISSVYSNNEYLAVFVPKDEVMKPFNEKILYAIFLNVMLMTIILPIIWYSTKVIVSPIHKLEEENKKIQKREYDKVKLVPTSIREIHHLSKSLVVMSQSIKAHEESQIKLMDSFIELIASAIDAKSEYTGAHCNRVPILTLLLAEAASNKKDGVFEKFELKTEEEKRELSIATWLHDCGKITTPEYVVDKATKLETIYNRIHEIRTRFEVIHRDLIIQSYSKLQKAEDKSSVDLWLKSEHAKLKSDYEFIANSNVGAEFTSDADKQRIHDISKREWIRVFDDSLGISSGEKQRYTQNSTNVENVLSDKHSHIIKRTNFDKEKYEKSGFKQKVPTHLYNLGEVYNLSISRGTLTDEERFKINEHVIMTIKMLDHLPFPEYLKRIPEYAGAHHETLIGTGYPKQLTRNNMSIPARIMAIADVFEALTASDRPYKDAKKLSDAIKILSFMVKDEHIDGDLFKLFLESGIYLVYAEEYLLDEQIDHVDIGKYI